jgi:hypothetical protein
MPKLVGEFNNSHDFEKHRARGGNVGLVASPIRIVQVTIRRIKERRTNNPSTLPLLYPLGHCVLTFQSSDVKRGLKWEKMLSRWEEYTASKTSKVKKRCRKGIPDKHRRAAWNTIIQVSLYHWLLFEMGVSDSMNMRVK